MSPRSDTSLAALLLTQRLVEAAGKPLTPKEYWRVVKQVHDPAALLGRDPADLRTDGISGALADRVVGLLGAGDAFARALGEAEQSGLRVLSSFDHDYPTALMQRLGDAAPPLLHAVGEVRLLTSQLVGIVGSRNVADTGATLAQEAAAISLEHGCGVVSGGAKGVDRLAMGAAIQAGGHAVGVLADSLQKALRDEEVRDAVAGGRLCLCTPFKPTAGFSVANAMGRNKIIYALSRATLVVAADADKGGSWAGAVEALRRGTAPVIAWVGDGAGDGNAMLVARGATPLYSVRDLFPLPVAGPAGDDAKQLELGL